MSQHTSIEIENLKCGGCASTIKNALKNFSEISDVQIDKDQDTVHLVHSEALDLAKVKDKLFSLGYPEKGSVNGLKGLGAKAVSYVSCAVGKLSGENE